MKKIIYLSLFLAITCGIAGFGLSYVNGITSPIIEERQIAAEKVNLDKIFPNGEFSDGKYSDKVVEKVFIAKDQGLIFKLNKMGYKENITMLLGVDNNGKIVGFNVLQFNDTKGIGDAILKDDFTNKIIGSKIDQEVDTISGATYSSKAVSDAIIAANEAYQAKFKK
ncbi:MAG: FMN-binding protein [Erysipelotrichaceae bacterium]